MTLHGARVTSFVLFSKGCFIWAFYHTPILKLTSTIMQITCTNTALLLYTNLFCLLTKDNNYMYNAFPQHMKEDTV